MPKGCQSKYIDVDRKLYNAIKQRAYRRLSKCSDRSIGVVCSGGGGVESAAIASGIRPAWGIDANPINKAKFNLSQMCSDYNELNHGSHVIRQALQDVNINSLQKPDIIWASLPCDRASNMSNFRKRNESSLDNLLAQKFIEILLLLSPNIVCLENVPGWARFEAFSMVLNHLKSTGYKVDYRNYNFSHYGVPQNRTRLILRAFRENIEMTRIPRNPSSGWYDSIFDLIPKFEEGDINPKIDNYLTEQNADRSRFILVENFFNQDKSLYSDEDSNCWTIRAMSGVDQKGNPRNKSMAIWNPESNSYCFLNSEAIARLSGFPKSYYMPQKSGYAAYICGLSVPPAFVSKVLASFSPLPVLSSG